MRLLPYFTNSRSTFGIWIGRPQYTVLVPQIKAAKVIFWSRGSVYFRFLSFCKTYGTGGYQLKNNIQDCYNLLNLSRDSTEEELKDAYIRLAKQYHPDSGTATADPRKFLQVKEAYLAIQNHMKNEPEYVPLKEAVEEFEDEEKYPGFKHKIPQHRQYLSYEGVGFGTPSQRQRQYQQYKVNRVTENIAEHRINKVSDLKESSAVIVNKKRARKIRSSNAIHRIVEDLIQDAMSKGDFDNLQGKGKPMNFQDRNAMVDSTTHNLNKILINNGYTPEWITLEKEIRDDIILARQKLAVARDRLGLPPFTPDDKSQWNFHTKTFEDAVDKVNNKIKKFNLIVPLFTKQIVPYCIDKEMKKVLENYMKLLPVNYQREVATPIMDKYLRDTQQSHVSRTIPAIEWKSVWNHIKDVFR